MLRPSASSANRIALLVIRTQNVPTYVSANGSSTSAVAISAMPIHAARGFFFRSRRECMAAQARSDTRSPSNPDGRKMSTVMRTMNANTSW